MRTHLLLVALLAPTVLSAQDAPPPPPPIPPALSGKAEVSFVSTSGNTSTQTIGAAAEVEYKPSPWLFKAGFGFVRQESDDEVKARSFAALLRGGRKIADPIEAFVEARYLKNTFAGVDNRFSADAGIAWAFWKEGAHLLKAEAALGFTKEDRVVGEDLSFATARAGLSYKWVISKTAELTDDPAFIADLSDASNWRFSNVLSVTAGLSTIFSLKASHTFAYVNEPPPGFGSTDTITSAALVAKF